MSVVCEELGAARGALVTVFLVTGAGYFVWRLSTFNPDHPVFSAVLYAAELCGFVLASLHIVCCARLAVRTSRPAPRGLPVDVFVTTANEPLQVLRRTLTAARDMDYRHETWVLDDGRRTETRRLARELGVRYVARAHSFGGRAGNLNNALEFAGGAFIAVFKGDQVPARNFLTETLGYFDDRNVGFVQTPLDFFNLDSFQHRHVPGRRLVRCEQSYTNRVLQRGRDYWNATLFSGSCAVVRRSALEQIRGFAPGTGAEDLHTSLRFHKAGWKSVYHAQTLAFGLAPRSVVSFLRKRERRTRGAFEVWRRERIAFSRALTLVQKASYLAAMLDYADGWRKSVLYAVPVVVLLTGWLPVATADAGLLLACVLFYLLGWLALEEVGRGYRRSLLAEEFGMLRFAASIWGTLGRWTHPLTLRTASQNVERIEASRALLAPQLFLLGLSALAVPVGITMYGWGELPLAALAAGTIWALANAAVAARVIQHALRAAAFMLRDYRFPLPVPVRLRFAGRGPKLGILEDVSSSGFKFHGELPKMIATGSRFSGELFLPRGPLAFVAVVTAEIMMSGGKQVHGMSCRFEWRSAADRERLEQYLYGSDLQWQLNDFAEQSATPIQWASRLLAGRRDERFAKTDWAPVLYHDATFSLPGPDIGVMSVPSSPGMPRLLATTKPLDPNLPVRFRMITQTGSQGFDAEAVPLRRLHTSTSPVFVYELAA